MIRRPYLAGALSAADGCAVVNRFALRFGLKLDYSQRNRKHSPYAPWPFSCGAKISARGLASVYPSCETQESCREKCGGVFWEWPESL